MQEVGQNVQLGRALDVVSVSPSKTIRVQIGEPAEATIATIPQTVMRTTELDVEPATELFGFVSISGSVTTTLSLSKLIRKETTATTTSPILANTLIASVTTPEDTSLFTTGTGDAPFVSSSSAASPEASSNSVTTFSTTSAPATTFTPAHFNATQTLANSGRSLTSLLSTSATMTTLPLATASSTSVGDRNTVALGLGVGLGCPLVIALLVAIVYIIKARKIGVITGHGDTPEMEAISERQSTKSIAEMHAIIELYARPILEVGEPETRHELRASALTRTLSFVSSSWSKRRSQMRSDESSAEGGEQGGWL